MTFCTNTLLIYSLKYRIIAPSSRNVTANEIALKLYDAKNKTHAVIHMCWKLAASMQRMAGLA